MPASVKPIIRMPKGLIGSVIRNPFFSRSTVWLDGERARLLDASGRSLNAVALRKAGDVPAALDALEQIVPKPAKPGVHTLRTLIGTPFVRYFAVPWRPLPTPPDWVSLARAQFVREGTLGTDTWRFAAPDGQWGRSRLAVAMPDPLCAGIAGVCKTRKLQLSAIEPAFTHAVAKCARRIEDGPIAVIELEDVDTQYAIAHIGFRRDRQWIGFISLPAPGSVENALRDATVLCTVQRPERVYVISAPRLRPWITESADIQWLAAPWETGTDISTSMSTDTPT
jgi:hypothetical protein